jgi:predicted Na+-dependent transporter
MSLIGLFAVLIFVTVALTAFSVGLVLTPGMVRAAMRRGRFWVLVAVNVALIPLVGYLVATALIPEASTGVIICAICAGGPLALKASQISKSDLTWSLTLTVTLLVANVVTLPLWSALLLDRSVALRPGDLVGVLVTAILVPVFLGGWCGRLVGNVEMWSRVTTLASNLAWGWCSQSWSGSSAASTAWWLPRRAGYWSR